MAEGEPTATVVEIPESPTDPIAQNEADDVKEETKEEEKDSQAEALQVEEAPPAIVENVSTDDDDDDDDDVIPADDYDVPTTVSEERKNKLLREARANRVAWIQLVHLPFRKETTSPLDATHIVKDLPSATRILTHLYGDGNIASRVKELVKTDSSSNAMRTAEELLEDEMDESGEDVKGILKDYQVFVSQLERPESAVVVNAIRTSLGRLGSDPATSLRTLVASTMEQLKRQLQQPDDDWSKRSLESFLYGQAQVSIWSTMKQEKEEDAEFSKKLQQLDFVDAKHLDLTCLDDGQDHLSTAVSSLLSMQEFHSPYEKLQRILKAYHNINESLTKAQAGKLPSADDVLPTLILTVLKAKPTQLVSNLRMLEVFGPPEYLRGEAGYAYTNLYGAVQFLRDLKLDQEGPITSLTITAQEFREGLEASSTAMKAQLEKSNKSKEIVPEEVPPPMPLEVPVAEVRAARLRGEKVDMEWARQRFMPSSTAAATSGETTAEVEELLPTGFSRNYSFLATRPEEIRMSDLPQLLEEYRMLVRATETLISERAQRASIERKEQLVKAERAIQKSAMEADLGLVGRSARKKPF